MEELFKLMVGVVGGWVELEDHGSDERFMMKTFLEQKWSFNVPMFWDFF